MKKEDAIKYLQQLYPNGGHCWLDEQRIEAISMAINALQEEPVSEELKKASKVWHDASEEPNTHIGSVVAIDCVREAIAFNVGTPAMDSIKDYNIEKWAYICDLLEL